MRRLRVYTITLSLKIAASIVLCESTSLSGMTETEQIRPPVRTASGSCVVLQGLTSPEQIPQGRQAGAGYRAMPRQLIRMRCQPLACCCSFVISRAPFSLGRSAAVGGRGRTSRLFRPPLHQLRDHQASLGPITGSWKNSSHRQRCLGSVSRGQALLTEPLGPPLTPWDLSQAQVLLRAPPRGHHRIRRGRPLGV